MRVVENFNDLLLLFPAEQLHCVTDIELLNQLLQIFLQRSIANNVVLDVLVDFCELSNGANAVLYTFFFDEATSRCNANSAIKVRRTWALGRRKGVVGGVILGVRMSMSMSMSESVWERQTGLRERAQTLSLLRKKRFFVRIMTSSMRNILLANVLKRMFVKSIIDST